MFRETPPVNNHASIGSLPKAACAHQTPAAMVAIGAALVAITATLAVKAEVRSSSDASLSAANSSFAVSAKRAHVIGRQLFVEGELFEVRGICYSPVPINESVYFAPYGDYFTPEYSFIWLRDLPLIKAMGVNLVRIYGWSPRADHSMFLDALHAHGLKLMATFYMGDATETPVGTLAQRKQVIEHFRNQVKQYASHPALLFWSFGNELNGIWNGFLQQLANAHEHGEQPCGYDESFDDKGGCWVHSMGTPRPGSDCAKQTYCVYSRLFGFIEEATKAAKSVADVLVVSAFADVDSLYDKVARAGHVAPSVDAWTSQVYRGASFGDFFANMTNATDKPILLTEYGVDAFHDECGTGDQSPCYNTLSSPHSHEDEHAQAVFARNLTREWTAQSSARKGCEHARRGSPNCTTAGAILMSWADEYWKGAKAQASLAAVTHKSLTQVGHQVSHTSLSHTPLTQVSLTSPSHKSSTHASHKSSTHASHTPLTSLSQASHPHLFAHHHSTPTWPLKTTLRPPFVFT